MPLDPTELPHTAIEGFHKFAAHTTMKAGTAGVFVAKNKAGEYVTLLCAIVIDGDRRSAYPVAEVKGLGTLSGADYTLVDAAPTNKPPMKMRRFIPRKRQRP